jgi:hypothetical protein
MSPQPRAQEAPAQTDPLAGLSDDGAEPYVTTQLEVARDLATEKEDLFKRIDANRSLLRNIKSTGRLSEKQAKAIDLFYPLRQKGGGENGE